MPVRVQGNAKSLFKASLQDFKNVFSLTDTGDFKHSVDQTKGDLFVNASGKLASANIHAFARSSKRVSCRNTISTASSPSTNPTR